jgi:hypothetical protein
MGFEKKRIINLGLKKISSIPYFRENYREYLSVVENFNA